MNFELVLCEDTILREIATPELTQKSIAMTYAFCLKSSETIDWAKINAAIIARWSKSGLIAIKKAAHSGSCFK